VWLAWLEVLPVEEEEVIEGEERIFRMSLKLRRSSSSGKIRTRSEDDSVRLEDVADPLSADK
jgi:hypothetical protein